MPYLNLDLDYFDHPQTLALIDLLGRGAEVLPIRLWAYCGRFYPETGRLAGHSAQEIERKLCWWGSKGKCVGGLTKADYLGKDAQGYYAKNWLKHQGHIFALKTRAKRMAEARWAGIRDAASNAVRNAASNAVRNAPSIPSLPSVTTTPPTPPRGCLSDPFHVFMDGFLRDYLKMLPGDPDPMEKEAVNAAYSRYGRAGKEILAYAHGDPQKAREGLDAIGDYFNGKHLSWKLGTIAEHFQQWIANPGEYDANKVRA